MHFFILIPFLKMPIKKAETGHFPHGALFKMTRIPYVSYVLSVLSIFFSRFKQEFSAICQKIGLLQAFSHGLRMNFCYCHLGLKKICESEERENFCPKIESNAQFWKASLNLGRFFTILHRETSGAKQNFYPGLWLPADLRHLRLAVNTCLETKSQQKGFLGWKVKNSYGDCSLE